MAITRYFVIVANRANTLSWQSLADFCQTVIDAMTAAAVTFPTPPVPLVNFQADVNELIAAIIDWGAVGSRGSHADYVAVLAAAQQVKNDLAAEAGYVQAIARGMFPGSYPDQITTVLLAGMRAKDDSNALPLWGPPNDLLQLVKQNLLGTGIAHIKWKKPNVVPGANSRPPAYNIYSSPDDLTYTLVTTVSSTVYDATLGTGVQKYFKVAPVSAAGEGGLSSSISVIGQ